MRYVFTSGVMTSEVAGAHITNVYKIPNVAIEVRCVGTNKTPIATYRGAGMPESCFPTECLVDVLAKEIGQTAVELRQRNMVRPADLPSSPASCSPAARFDSKVAISQRCWTPLSPRAAS